MYILYSVRGWLWLPLINATVFFCMSVRCLLSLRVTTQPRLWINACRSCGIALSHPSGMQSPKYQSCELRSSTTPQKLSVGEIHQVSIDRQQDLRDMLIWKWGRLAVGGQEHIMAVKAQPDPAWMQNQNEAMLPLAISVRSLPAYTCRVNTWALRWALLISFTLGPPKYTAGTQLLLVAFLLQDNKTITDASQSWDEWKCSHSSTSPDTPCRVLGSSYCCLRVKIKTYLYPRLSSWYFHLFTSLSLLELFAFLSPLLQHLLLFLLLSYTTRPLSKHIPTDTQPRASGFCKILNNTSWLLPQHDTNSRLVQIKKAFASQSEEILRRHLWREECRGRARGRTHPRLRQWFWSRGFQP